MTSDANASQDPHVLGSLRIADGAGVVRIEERCDADAASVWSALTEPHRLADWYGRVDGDLRGGGHLRIHIDGPDIDSTGRIVECRRGTFLRVRTRETDESARRGNGQAFDQLLDVTLTADGDGTALVVEVSGFPPEKIAAYAVGWQLHVEALTAYATGRDAPDVGARWTALDAAYRERAARLR